MSRTFDSVDWNAEAIRVTRKALLVVGMIAASGGAMAQTNVPDAQVEANVLKALAGAPDLSNQSITTKTVYGTVTLSGSVTTEALRTEAENLAANANGVKKVVDEMQLGSGQVAGNQQQGGPAPGMVLMSDGSYGPAGAATAQDQGDPNKPAPGSAPATMAQRNNPDADQALDQQMGQQQGTAQGANAQPGTQQPVQPQYQPQPAPQNQASAPQYPQRRPMYPPAGYPGYTPYGYPPQQAPPAGYAQQGGQQPPMGGQVAGQNVTIPNGALLRVRINRSLRSDKTQPGTVFDGVVVNDVVADGVVAIPRGAAVQGTVVDAKGSGALSGRGEMSIQLTQVTLGGRNYPIVSDLWAHNGGDKTIETVNKTAGFGALGAVVGAVAGGGVGAAIGGGVGAAAGLGSSAASGRGQVIIPSESIVVFHTAQPTQVATVSEQEMQRLAYGVPAAADAPPARRVYRVYPGYYPPPGYYPYAPYGYPNP